MAIKSHHDGENRRSETDAGVNKGKDGVSLTSEGIHIPAEDLEPAENPDTGKRFVDHAPVGCPRCGGELDPVPYGSWACWSCAGRVSVRDQGGDER